MEETGGKTSQVSQLQIEETGGKTSQVSQLQMEERRQEGKPAR